MRIAVYHPDFSSNAGGGELAALGAVRALSELGHEVELLASSVDRDVLSALCSSDSACPPLKLINFDHGDACVKAGRSISQVPLLGYQLTVAALARAVRALASTVSGLSEEYDLVITMQAGSGLRGLSVVLGDVVYFHYPVYLPGLVSLGEYVPGVLAPLVERLVVNMGYRALSEVVCGGFRIYKVATNSTWTKRGVIDLNARAVGTLPESCGRELAAALVGASVVYPPVDYELYSSMYDPNSKKDLVLTVSRYSPGKNLWSVVYAASKVTEAHFVIAGTTKTPDSNKVVGQLEALIDKLRVKNVTLERDVAKERLVDLYEEAKVYLHPLYAEHFGIAIAEGAAAGAVPVVFKDGGGWIDIASRIDPMLGYTNIDEAAAIVRQLLGNEDLWLRLSRRSVEVAKDFSWDNYKRRLDAAVREAYEMKKSRSSSKSG